MGEATHVVSAAHVMGAAGSLKGMALRRSSTNGHIKRCGASRAETGKLAAFFGGPAVADEWGRPRANRIRLSASGKVDPIGQRHPQAIDAERALRSVANGRGPQGTSWFFAADGTAAETSGHGNLARH